jgi:hypothetical protein
MTGPSGAQSLLSMLLLPQGRCRNGEAPKGGLLKRLSSTTLCRMADIEHLVIPSPAPFACPTCDLQYKLVRAEADAGSSSSQLACRGCGGLLNGREGRFVLKYFLVDRPKDRAKRARQRSQAGIQESYWVVHKPGENPPGHVRFVSQRAASVAIERIRCSKLSNHPGRVDESNVALTHIRPSAVVTAMVGSNSVLSNI